MPAFIDVTGLVFGRLTVLARSTNADSRQGQVQWRCRCLCGREVIVRSQRLRTGVTRSCGCLHNEELRERATTHGLRRSREWSIWQNAKRRCFDPTSKHYPRYGGRGITMCAAWRNDFETFLRDVGPCQPGLSLDRINNDGNYQPGNVRWATAREQASNQSTTIRFTTLDGDVLSMEDLARRLGLRGGEFGRQLRRSGVLAPATSTRKQRTPADDGARE